MPREFDDDLPERLIQDMARAPLVPEHEVDLYVEAGGTLSGISDVSSHELDVLRCLSHGMTAAMAADALGRAEPTVQRQIRAARYKLKAKDTTHAVAIAIRQGLIT